MNNHDRETAAAPTSAPSITQAVISEVRARTARAYAIPAETFQDSLIEQVAVQSRRIAELESRLESLQRAAARSAERLDDWSYRQYRGANVAADMLHGEADMLRAAVRDSEGGRR